MQNLQNELVELLIHEDNLVIDGHLNKNKIVELALKVEPQLIALLIKSETFKKHFFQEVESVLVFDKIKFQRFVNNKSFLPDSYTAFKNKIGLITNDDDLDNFISSSNDIVLAWPHKDCVLEGGQTKEDQKRNEIFWNETLAPDSVDRLLDAKALTNFKKFDKDGEHEVSEITGKENLIIKGNNLLVLSSLLRTHRGKIKLIYIDPPYNTGNDGFNYNDNFNHSTWLTFMKNRLKLANELLSDSGTIMVSCDDNEQAYLKVLMDEVFGKENFVTNFIWRRRKTQANLSKHVAPVHDFMICFAKNKLNLKLNKIPYSKEFIKKTFSNPDNDERGLYQTGPLARPANSSNKEYTLTMPNGREITAKWSCSQETFSKYVEENRLVIPRGGDGMPRIKIFLSELEGQIPNTWLDNVATNDEASKEIETLFGTNAAFSYAKPEGLIKYVIDLTTVENDIVLDFHLGSGTTASSSHKMNRRYIGIEQMDYIETVAVERLKKVIQGEQGGISKDVNWNGGGSFIYVELSKYNQKYIDSIQVAESKDELISLWEQLEATAFLSYQFDKKTFNERIDAFKTAPIEDMKQYLIEIIDKNQLYVNYSEIEDETFGVSETDKVLNKQFYSIK